MNLRKCTNADIEELIAIGRQTYYDTVHASNSDEIMYAYLDTAFTHDKIAKELQKNQSHFYFLYDNDLLVAYMKVNFSPDQSDLNTPNSLELERIYVQKTHKRQGYGQHLLDSAITIGKENNCATIWLGVWENNTAALTFYKKSGFKIFDQHNFQMGDDLQIDYLLKKDL